MLGKKQKIRPYHGERLGDLEWFRIVETYRSSTKKKYILKLYSKLGLMLLMVFLTAIFLNHQMMYFAPVTGVAVVILYYMVNSNIKSHKEIVENFKANRYDVFEQTIGRKYEEEGKYYFSSDICTKIDCFTKELYDFYEEGDEIRAVRMSCGEYLVVPSKEELPKREKVPEKRVSIASITPLVSQVFSKKPKSEAKSVAIEDSIDIDDVSQDAIESDTSEVQGE